MRSVDMRKALSRWRRSNLRGISEDMRSGPIHALQPQACAYTTLYLEAHRRGGGAKVSSQEVGVEDNHNEIALQGDSASTCEHALIIPVTYECKVDRAVLHQRAGYSTIYITVAFSSVHLPHCSTRVLLGCSTSNDLEIWKCECALLRKAFMRDLGTVVLRKCRGQGAT